MTRHFKLLLTTLTTTAILALAITNASANRLSINSSRLWKATWTSVRLIANARTILCPLTLEGSFHSATIAKTAELVGYITGAVVENPRCVGGNTTAFSETLPWHVRFRGYSGILPNITLLIAGLIGARFRVQPTGELACNATSTAAKPIVANFRVNGVTHVSEWLEPEANVRIPLESGLCPFGGEGSFEGMSQTLAEVPSGGRITVTLI